MEIGNITAIFHKSESSETRVYNMNNATNVRANERVITGNGRPLNTSNITAINIIRETLFLQRKNPRANGMNKLKCTLKNGRIKNCKKYTPIDKRIR
jgi:hypothetical protein